MHISTMEGFQSTSSIQRKTMAVSIISTIKPISIHFLYTEEDPGNETVLHAKYISIHFLYTEEDEGE